MEYTKKYHGAVFVASYPENDLRIKLIFPFLKRSAQVKGVALDFIA